MIEGKQAVLYNTTIEALLKGDEQYLAKLRDVLDTFKERDDILLWWRPHPLIDSTLQSMRPQLLAKYREIVAEYKNKAWGIFDDTSDLHRAIAWCEAYYGDPSSVAYLFQVTGKPVMISCLAGNKETPPCIPFSYLVEGEGSLWFSTTIFNGLFKVDRETWQAEYLGSFPNEPLLQGNLYMKPAYGNGKIYFPPFNAKEIGVYSLSDQTFSKIAYDCPKDGEVKMAFTAAVFHEGYVYFTPYYYPAIMRLDTATGEITYHNEWLEPLQELVGTDKGELLVNPLVNGDTLMIPACKANAVLEFDMNTQTSTIREIGKKGTLYNGICYDGEHYWLSPRHCERLTKWNPRTGDTTEISVPHSDGADSPDAFTPIVYFQGHVWLFPRVRKARQTVKIDVQTGIAAIAEQFAHEDEKGVRSLQGHRYNYPHVTDDCIIEFNNLNGTLTEYKSENEVCRKGVIQYPPETLRQIKELRTKALFSCELAPFSMYDGRYYENIFAGLGDLLDYIVLFRGCDEEFFKAFRRLKLYWAEDRATDDTVGAVIYRCVREVACGRK
jgi:outer membrane protein assembly factor BamB